MNYQKVVFLTTRKLCFLTTRNLCFFKNPETTVISALVYVFER